jgi:hypothetical protein
MRVRAFQVLAAPPLEPPPAGAADAPAVGVHGVARRRVPRLLPPPPLGLALILSVIGISGLAAFTVTQRRQELAVRMALGATARHIAGLFLESLRWPVLGGLALGLPLAGLGATVMQRTRLVPGAATPDATIFLAALSPAEHREPGHPRSCSSCRTQRRVAAAQPALIQPAIVPRHSDGRSGQ